MRSAISAAPALVKVRQRMFDASTPARSRRSTRAVRTCVLPVPAEADRAAWSRGLDARCWSASSGVRGRRRWAMLLWCGARPRRLGRERAGLALRRHPAALVNFDPLEDAGREIRILGHVGIERAAIGHIEDEQAADHPTLLEQRGGIDDEVLLAGNE